MALCHDDSIINIVPAITVTITLTTFIHIINSKPYKKNLKPVHCCEYKDCEDPQSLVNIKQKTI